MCRITKPSEPFGSEGLVVAGARYARDSTLPVPLMLPVVGSIGSVAAVG
jgi:hypothetical protein